MWRGEARDLRKLAACMMVCGMCVCVCVRGRNKTKLCLSQLARSVPEIWNPVRFPSCLQSLRPPDYPRILYCQSALLAFAMISYPGCIELRGLIIAVVLRKLLHVFIKFIVIALKKITINTIAQLEKN